MALHTTTPVAANPTTTLPPVAGYNILSTPNADPLKDVAIQGGVPTYATDANGNVTGLAGLDGVAVPFSGIESFSNASRMQAEPKGTDRSTTGYTTSNYWQAKGRLYKPIYSAADGAAWDALPPTAALPVDIFTAAGTKFAGGTAQMKAGYIGAAFDISVTIAATPTAATINILADGKLDVATLQSYAALADSGTLVTVTRIVDQSGAGNHFYSTSTTTANCTVTAGSTGITVSGLTGVVGVGQTVTIVSGGGTVTLPAVTISAVGTGVGGDGTYTLSAAATGTGTSSVAVLKFVDNPLTLDWDIGLQAYVICGDTRTGATERIGRFTIAMSTAANNAAIFCLGRGTNAAPSGNDTLAVLGDYRTATAGTSQFIFSTNYTYPSLSTSVDGQSTHVSGGNAFGGVTLQAGPCFAGVVSGGSSIVFYCNEFSSTTANNYSGTTFTGGVIGRYSVGGNNCFRYVGIVITTAAVATAAKVDLLKQSFYTQYNCKPQTRNQLFMCGDSRLTQALTKKFMAPPVVLKDMMRNECTVYPIALGGGTSSTIATKVIPQVVALATATGTKNVVLYLCGYNDLLAGSSVAATLASTVANIAALKVSGAYVICIAELSSTTGTNNVNTNIPLLRAALVAAGTAGLGCDAVIDVYGFAPAITPSNSAYYPDGTHPSSAIVQYFCAQAQPLIDAYFDKFA